MGSTALSRIVAKSDNDPRNNRSRMPATFPQIFCKPITENRTNRVRLACCSPYETPLFIAIVA